MARLKELGPGQQALTATAPLNALSASDLDDMLQLALRGGRTVVSSVTSKAGVNSQGLRLAHPLACLGEAIGAIAVELERADLEQQKSVTKLLKWGNAWLELLLNQQLSGNVNDYGLMDMLQLVLRAEHFQEAVMATIGVMAHRYGAERASLGVYRSDRVQPIALSGSTSFSPRSTLAWQLGQAMDESYVAAAHVRAGERVKAGFVLAELDDRELRLDLRQLEGDLNELSKQYRKSLAALDHAEARILKAQMAQAEARIDLLQQHLSRTRLVAPFAAIVVSGDLSRSLGKPV